MTLEENIFDLVARTSTCLPEDVEAALLRAKEGAAEASAERNALETMLRNASLAKERRLPICQDTGVLIFTIKAPAGYAHRAFEEQAKRAVARATAAGVLRQNCVETLSGVNTGTNIGIGSPVFHWIEEDIDHLDVTLMLKGGGSENMGAQYSLPDARLGAGRDLEGVRLCVLDAVCHAQGMGCAPGILGVAIGGDRATGYEESKVQLMRRIGERSQNPQLAALEERILKEANQLGIGAMGFGGRTTLLDVFIGERSRLPACYFVSISYMCWCCRRQRVQLPL
ncbi:MAG: fumarate hydratase [Victivallales bacterium]|nr:fumarate hydratase [Victivallales bacterium]